MPNPDPSQSGSARWLVSTAIGDPKMYDGSPVMYHDPDFHEPTGPVREDYGYCAIVEADTPQEAARKAVEWLAQEHPNELMCGECERPHVNGVDVVRYENVVHIDGDRMWRADAA